jgi:probable HAF family extracellular repeat protein
VTANGSVVGANAIALVPTNAFGGGSDIWEYTGGATKVINLTSPEVTGSGSVLRQATFVGANASGEVIGYNVRYNGGTTSLGNAGWLFDGNQTVEISFPSASSTGTEITVPQAISPTGAVVGYYDLYSGGTTFVQHAFEWTELNGFTDLGSSILNGLNAEGWQALATATLTTGSGLVGLPGYDGRGHLQQRVRLRCPLRGRSGPRGRVDLGDFLPPRGRCTDACSPPCLTPAGRSCRR